MLGLTGGATGIADNVSGRREFGSVEIFERVIATEGRTINIDNIATISVGVIKYTIVRWLCWIAAVGTALPGFGNVATAFQFGALSVALPGLLLILVAAGLVFLGLRFRDVNVLIIGASDGSRSVFPSRDKAYLEEVRAFLTRKINERDVSAKLAADFKAAVSQPIVSNNYYGGTHIKNEGVMVNGDGNQIAYETPDAMVGTSQLRLNGNGHRIGTTENRYDLNGAAGVQIGAGHVSSATNTGSYTQIDFSDVLPQVGELHSHYARIEGMTHIEQRLAELERLMRSGAALPPQKSRIRELAGELGTLFQAYPAMVQFFSHVGKLVGI